MLIMKAVVIEFLIKQVLTWLGSIKSEQWEKAKELVVEAAKEFAHLPGDKRREWVVTKLKEAWADLSPFLVNLLVDGAFGFLRKQSKV